MGQTNPNSLKNLIPVKPGEVRNPRGKPKGLKNISTCVKWLLTVKAEKYPDPVLRKYMVDNGYPNMAMLIATKKVKLTVNDKVKPETQLKATESIEDRDEGKPTQKTEITGKDGENLFPSAEMYEKMKGLPTDALMAIQNIIQSSTTTATEKSSATESIEEKKTDVENKNK